MAVEELSLSTVTTVPVNWFDHPAFAPGAEPTFIESVLQTPPRATESRKHLPLWTEVCICIGGMVAAGAGAFVLTLGLLR